MNWALALFGAVLVALGLLATAFAAGLELGRWQRRRNPRFGQFPSAPPPPQKRIEPERRPWP